MALPYLPVTLLTPLSAAFAWFVSGIFWLDAGVAVGVSEGAGVSVGLGVAVGVVALVGVLDGVGKSITWFETAASLASINGQ